jgi:hypothetical protein
MNVICGCDGVTYFNPSLSALAGVSIKSGGECPSNVSVKCTNNKCAAGQFCNLRSAACVSLGVTNCWAMPPSCNGNDPAHNTFCPGGNQCVSLCSAIKSQKAYREDTVACP